MTIDQLIQHECDERINLEEHFKILELSETIESYIMAQSYESYDWYNYSEDIEKAQNLLRYLFDVVDFYAEFLYLCPNFTNSQEFVEYFEPIKYSK